MLLDLVLSILAGLMYLGLFYFGFLAWASLENHGGLGALTPEAKALVGWIFVLFLAVDFTFNTVPATLMFLQLPTLKTWTFSKRLAANIARNPTTWRGKLAQKIVARYLLTYTPNY